jgi:hypothetical protein
MPQSQLELAVNHAIRDRQAYISRALGTAADAKRPNAWREYGYPDYLQFDDFFRLYERHGIAHGVVQLLVGKCWETRPEVIEGAEKDSKRPLTAWEREFNALAKRTKLWRAFADADRRRLVGRYSCLILQIADGKAWNRPITGAVGKLVRVIPAWEGQMRPSEWNTDPLSPNYGMPTMWAYNEAQVDPNTEDGTPERSVSIHPDRVVIVGDLRDGVPFLKAGYNDFVNLEKILGGSGESFLKNAARQLAVEYDKDVNLADIAKNYGVSPAELQVAFNDAARDLNQGLDVLLAVQGGTAKPLVATVPDPQQHFDIALQSACASVQMPSKVVVGNQTGERASTEDLRSFNKRAQGRRTDELSGDIETLVQHLIDKRLLSKVSEFAVVWDDLTESTQAEKLAAAKEMALINREFVGSGEPVPFSSAEIRNTAGFDNEGEALPPLPDVEPDAEV